MKTTDAPVVAPTDAPAFFSEAFDEREYVTGRFRKGEQRNAPPAGRRALIVFRSEPVASAYYEAKGSAPVGFIRFKNIEAAIECALKFGCPTIKLLSADGTVLRRWPVNA